MKKRATPPKGIQSIEIGGRLLDALTRAQGPLNLGALAQEVRMSPSKARRYLVSFGRIGLVSQDEFTSRYDFGWFALRLGLAALSRSDVLRQSRPVLARLREKLNQTTALVLWLAEGPTVVHFEPSDRGLLRLVAPLGATLPLLGTAAGRIFAAFGPPTLVDMQVAREIKSDEERPYTKPVSRAQAKRLIDDARRRGLSRTVGEAAQGVCTMAVAVRDSQGAILAAIVVLGHRGLLDASWNGGVAMALRAAAAELEQALGHRATTNSDRHTGPAQRPVGGRTTRTVRSRRLAA